MKDFRCSSRGPRILNCFVCYPKERPLLENFYQKLQDEDRRKYEEQIATYRATQEVNAPRLGSTHIHKLLTVIFILFF